MARMDPERHKHKASFFPDLLKEGTLLCNEGCCFPTLRLVYSGDGSAVVLYSFLATHCCSFPYPTALDVTLQLTYYTHPAIPLDLSDVIGLCLENAGWLLADS